MFRSLIISFFYSFQINANEQVNLSSLLCCPCHNMFSILTTRRGVCFTVTVGVRQQDVFNRSIQKKKKKVINLLFLTLPMLLRVLRQCPFQSGHRHCTRRTHVRYLYRQSNDLDHTMLEKDNEKRKMFENVFRSLYFYHVR